MHFRKEDMVEQIDKSTDEFKTVFNFIAKKDHVINHNNVHLTFKQGEKYSNIDKKWKDTLKIEKVI